MRLFVCQGCGRAAPLEPGEDGRRRLCDECREIRRWMSHARVEDPALNDGHGRLISLPDDEKIQSHVLSMRSILDRDRQEAEEAVELALRNGALGTTHRGRPCFAQEVDRLVAAADKAAEGLTDHEVGRLIAGSRLRDSHPRGAAGVYGISTRGAARGRIRSAPRAEKGAA